MRDNLREKLNTEITRKQFLQFMGAALLTVFGFHNLLSLLGGSRDMHHVFVPHPLDNQTDGFGTRRFGV
jgi:hypothetical protein